MIRDMIAINKRVISGHLSDKEVAQYLTADNDLLERFEERVKYVNSLKMNKSLDYALKSLIVANITHTAYVWTRILDWVNGE